MKFLISTAIAAVALAGLAYAGEMEGTVESVDMEEHTIMLEDGTTVMAAEGVSLEGVMKGDMIKIMTDDNNMATMVEKQ